MTLPDNLLEVRVIPRASRNKIEIDSRGNVKVWVTAAPVEGEANDAVISLLSKSFGVPKSSLRIVQGASSANKRVDMGKLTREAALQRLRAGNT